jgi:hypothetical protein
MTQVLFKEATVAVCLNGKESASFPIHKGVRQGCPLAPFLFLFVGEALHAASMHRIQRGLFPQYFLTWWNRAAGDGAIYR